MCGVDSYWVVGLVNWGHGWIRVTQDNQDVWLVLFFHAYDGVGGWV